MNFFGIVFALVNSALLLSLPRRWAALPLLLGSAYITRDQQLVIGPVHLPMMRILIAAGLIRVAMNGERISGGINSLDRIARLWAIWNACSIVFHKAEFLVFRLGIFYDIVGFYYLFRVFIRGLEDVRALFKMLCVLLVPLAVTMLVEKLTGNNLLGLIGFGPADVEITNGHYRAQGPFSHPILAGTIGGVSLPLALCFWRENRAVAITGIVAALAIVFASGSSGPIITTLAGVAALTFWVLRRQVRTIRWLAVIGVMFLSLVMNDPVYYLVARIDITGGSTGYFRAKLIESAIAHLSEWWFAGTDYTRHWMASGIEASAVHTDMTNYYIQIGVWGGLALIVLFVWMLVVAFRRIGQALRASRGAPSGRRFLIWGLGSSLFAHTVTFFSISYFDQTIAFLCFLLACIASLPVLQKAPAQIQGQGPLWRSAEQIAARS
ncbi:MAG: hypothetical protein JO015_05935 [Verrucomicrobia bacterium]|nr:hypothetical protein [Verrucomicrobiota bacterium]